MGFWNKKEEELNQQGFSGRSPDIFSHVVDSSRVEDAKPAPSSVTEALTDQFGKVKSALGVGTVIQGKLTFDSPVRIEGSLSGEVYSSEAVYVGSTGKIEATLEVACLVVLGKVKGIIKATERIEIREGGSIEGSVITPVLVIDSGSRFNGDCQMLSLLEQRSKESKTGKVFDIPSEISKSPASSHLSLKDNNKEVERDSL